MTIHELAKLLLDQPDSPELPANRVINLTLMPTLEDHAGIGRDHRLLSWTDAEGFPRSVTF